MSQGEVVRAGPASVRLAAALGVRPDDIPADVIELQRERARRRADAVRAIEAERAAAERERLLAALDVPPLYSDAVISPALNAAHRWARTYVERFPDVDAVAVLAGGVGTGKTYLSWAIARELVGRGQRAIVAKLPAIVRAIRASWGSRDGSSEIKTLRRYTSPSLLVIDEVSRHVLFGNQQVQQHLYDIVDDRLERRRPTILTTNERDGGLRDLLGEALYDRLRLGSVVRFTGDSLRKRRPE